MFLALVVCLLLSMQLSLSFNVGIPMRSRIVMSKMSNKMTSGDSSPAVIEKAKKEIIGKTALLTKLQESTSFKKKDIEMVLNAFVAIIHDEVLHKGAELRLRDFGTFKQSKRSARMGRHPRTGETIPISETTSVSFTGADGIFKGLKGI